MARRRSSRRRCPTPARGRPDPTPPPVGTRGGTPPPSYYCSFPYFLAPLVGVVGCSSGVLRLLRLCDGKGVQRFAGRGLVATRSGWLLRWFCSRCTPASLRSLGRRFDFVSRHRHAVTELAVVLPPQFGLVASGCRSRRVRWTTFAICVVWKRCSSSSMRRGLPTSPCVTGPHAIGLGLMPVSVQAAVPGCVAERSIML